jgi:hypothetical protein
LIFNRPEPTRRVWDQIRLARPARLLVVADGPRAERPDDARLCAEARAITEDIDWDCDVQRSYADRNLGLKVRVESGLSWAFERVDEAVILEDDCLPDPTFFSYAGQLLERYRHDDRVMAIGGSRMSPVVSTEPKSYYFSRMPLIWGWATWQRAWRHYDGTMSRWPELRDRGWLDSVLPWPMARRYWAYQFETNRAAKTAGTWDFAWILACWLNRGLAIHPTTNLVTNIGFGPGGTHNTDPDYPGAARPIEPMSFPLRHPDGVVPDDAEDEALDALIFGGRLAAVLERAKRRLRSR